MTAIRYRDRPTDFGARPDCGGHKCGWLASERDGKEIYMLSLWSLRRLILLMVCLFAAPSFAETAYLEYSAGIAIVPYQNLTGAIASSAGQSGRIEPKPGYTVGAAIGMPFLKLFRAEIALNYRSSDINEMAVQPGARGANGDISLFSAMANGYVDYDLDLGVVPYLGFGVGYGRLKLRADNRDARFAIRDKASVFVWNIMVGGTLPYSDTVDFTAEYRYLASSDFDFGSLSSATDGTRTDSRFDSEYDAHELVFGMR
ncbi:MAG: outer membrane beta-barrel protein, partial [Myxococcota bacterium]